MPPLTTFCLILKRRFTNRCRHRDPGAGSRCALSALRLLLALVLLAPAARAQTTATLRGTVTDSLSGQPLVGVSVGLEGRPGGTATDALGQFRLGGLAAGTYTLRAGALGYRGAARPVTLATGENRAAPLVLGAAPLNLSEVLVSQNQNRDPNQSLPAINQIDKVLRPVNSAQDLLRLVPGLFIAQHAGGGKAEQIFLRGFDVDHGTDFAVSVDGLPVNMVSHAHGQGYADFHFVIPETVEQLKVYKGPYTARFGDFATAGAGEFTTKTRLDASQVKLEVGRFDTRRALVMLDLLGSSQRHLLTKKPESFYVAGEYYYTDSYFEQPQDFKRFNGLAKYTGQFSDRTALTLLGSHFTSRWDASGQIPQRAVDSGLITRFGSIDPSEGGDTDRTNASAVLTTGAGPNAVIRQQFYYSRYHFNLFSNFTFFAADPDQGDEIKQQDARDIFGYTGTYDRDDQLGARGLHTTFGLATRLDNADVSLLRATQRRVTGSISTGRVAQRSFSAYLDETLSLTERLTLNAGLRTDVFVFGFNGTQPDETQGEIPLDGRKTRGRVSPKLSLYYQAAPTVQLFARSGLGFHSNDARGVVRGDVSGNALPQALGYEVGSTFKPLPGMVVNAALWALNLDDELVYIGDEGGTENAGQTRRYGADLALRYQLTPALFADVDLNYNHGRLRGAAEGENYIPLAPRLTSVGGLTYKAPRGLSASLRYRRLDARPANEDNSIRAEGYFLLDGVVSYSVGRFQVGVIAENLLNVDWNEAQFATESRLKNETEPVDELHFTPGTPFYFRLNASISF